MLEQATRSLGGLSEVIRLAALVLLSVMFTGVGIALAILAARSNADVANAALATSQAAGIQAQLGFFQGGKEFL